MPYHKIFPLTHCLSLPLRTLDDILLYRSHQEMTKSLECFASMQRLHMLPIQLLLARDRSNYLFNERSL
jgi:hypothetical protein